MTAISIVVQQDGAHLLTDGALYDERGVVLTVCSKVLIAHEMRLALAPAGRCTAADLAKALRAANPLDQAAAMARLPAIAQAIRARNVKQGPFMPDLHIYAILWSDARDEPQAWMLATDQPEHWGPYRSGTWIPVDSMIGTDRALPEILGRSDACPGTLDMVSDGRTIIEHQRRTKFDDGRYYVGGHGELVTVRRTGVHQRILCRWPDKAGRTIQP